MRKSFLQTALTILIASVLTHQAYGSSRCESVVQKKGHGVAHARVAISGSHTDYNNGLTLAALLPVKTSAQVTPREDLRVSASSAGLQTSFEVGKEIKTNDWSDYLKGVMVILEEDGHEISGADIIIESDIPSGAGISSSAALVTSIFKAYRSAFDLTMSDLEIAKMGQRVEHYVGANTGLLDQMTISLLGDNTESALLINFKDLGYQQVQMPENSEFVIVHSGLTHKLTDADGTRNYSTRRKECEGACEQLGIQSLSDLTSAELLDREGELDPTAFLRAKHVVGENDRVNRFIESAAEGNLENMGKIMDESHASQRDNYDISEEPIDVLVEFLQNAEGVYGAQLTGGGFGGAVVFLADKGRGRQIAQQILSVYEAHEANRGQYSPSIVAPLE